MIDKNADKKTPKFALIALVPALLITGCGGDDGSSATPPVTGAPANSAPQFTSGGTASVEENSTGPVYTAAANDADGDTVSFSLSGGPDASRFSINGAGAVSFIDAPDFDKPRDVGRDNSYEITVSASDGRATLSQNVAISVTNDKEGIAVTRIATLAGEGKALSAGADGEVTAFLADGQAVLINGQTGAQNSSQQVFQSANVQLLTGFNAIEGSGLITGFYAIGQLTSGELVVSYLSSNRVGVGRETVFTAPTNAAPKASIAQFDGNNNFHVAIGVSQDSDAQDPNSDFGKLYQLQVDPGCGASFFTICLGMTVIGDGVRQPGGAGLLGDQVLFADQGGSVEHELNFYPAASRPIDFGWPDREGSQTLSGNAPAAVNGPTLVYGFGSDPFQGQGIVLGSSYAGAIAELTGRYVFGDTDGSIYSIEQSVLTDGFLHTDFDMELRSADFAPDAGTIDSPVGFATNSNGALFILDTDGEVFRVDPA